MNNPQVSPMAYGPQGGMNPNDPLIANQSPDPQIAPQGLPPMPNNYTQQPAAYPGMAPVPNQYGQPPISGAKPIPNQYGQPATVPPGGVTMPSNIVVNQQNAGQVLYNPDMFKLTPVSIICPSCKKPIITNVETSFSCLACLFCCCTYLLFYICIQAIRGKDICCQDADHKCPFCGRLIASYRAC